MKDEAMKDEMIKRLVRFFLSILFITLSFITPSSAFAVPLIRDAEIEHTLHEMADPIFTVAGLKSSAVHIFIVQDDSLNSYVAGGSNVFIHTGLIMQTTTPDMLIGVIAHETGHIAGGHLAKGAEKLKDAQLDTILTYVVGAVAGMATKKPEAAAAVIAGGSTTLDRNFIAFTRTHEEAADQAALGYLDKLHISASGLQKTFALLERHQREHGGSVDPYLLTHPLSSSRIEHVRNHAATSSIPEGQYPKNYDMLHKRMVAKLYGFLQSPERTMQKYPLSDKGVAARMARAIAYYKMPDLQKSIAEMDDLLKESPSDPFFHELKGQILFENGHVPEALTSYQNAVQLLPNSPLLLADLAKVELAQSNAPLSSAIAHLEKSTTLDNSNDVAWHFLAIAYGKAGNKGMSSLALAEEDLLNADYDTALENVNRALDVLKESSPARRRAQDVKAHAIEMRQQEKKENSSF
jgi:predicted Zn-dependent protease